MFVADTASFDFLFVYRYLIRSLGRSLFSFAALDMKTFAMAVLRRDFRDAAKRNMPEWWFTGAPQPRRSRRRDRAGRDVLPDAGGEQARRTDLS